jgi:hypothetical protein
VRETFDRADWTIFAAKHEDKWKWFESIALGYVFSGVDLKDRKTSPLRQYLRYLAPEVDTDLQRTRQVLFVTLRSPGDIIPAAITVPFDLRLFDETWEDDKLPELFEESGLRSDLGLSKLSPEGMGLRKDLGPPAPEGMGLN